MSILLGGLFYSIWMESPLSPEAETAPIRLIHDRDTTPTLTASGYVVAQRQALVATKGTGRLDISEFQ